MSNNGPKITLSMSCAGCVHVQTARYAEQGGTGVYVHCEHPERHSPKRARDMSIIGDTNWTTPGWCPERKRVYLEFVNDLTKWKDAQ